MLSVQLIIKKTKQRNGEDITVHPIQMRTSIRETFALKNERHSHQSPATCVSGYCSYSSMQSKRPAEA